jgi:hypothetical protein
MTSVTLGSIELAGLARAAATNGVINAVINGAIQLFLLRGHGPIALSADAISTDEHTVLGSAVMLAVTLAPC